MKNSWEWTESDVLELIANEVPESLHLDYKRSESLWNSDGKKTELSKDVSAFANSAGGVLLYGVSEDGNKPISIDGGVDPEIINKEWIEQVINSRIQRRISGIRINPIKISSHENRVIYAVDIPQSNLAPHMAHDKRFYKRFNFESVPMEEYEIRDVGNRYITPDLKFNFQLSDSNLRFNEYDDLSEPIDCSLLLSNDSLVPAKYSSVRLNIDSRLELFNAGTFQQGIGSNPSFIIDGETYSAKVMYSHISIPNSQPILYGMNFNISNAQIRFPKERQTYFIIVDVYTEGVEPKQFQFFVSHDGNTIRIKSEDVQEALR